MTKETDQELMELAAKAACYEYAKQGGYIVIDGIPGKWNPLTDDGDALRLAVKLNLQIRQYPIYDRPCFAAYVCDAVWDFEAESRAAGSDATVRYAECNGDPCAATRRAIVRAAAEIGRAMP